MADQLGGTGDFAWAYVIAHEMGHHVQQQLGTSDGSTARRARTPTIANELSVRLELQADCYAGVWAHTRLPGRRPPPATCAEAFTGGRGGRRRPPPARAPARRSATPSPTAPPRSGSAGSSGHESGQPGACDTFTAGEV